MQQTVQYIYIAANQELLRHLNGVRLTIEFTGEQEEDRTLPHIPISPLQVHSPDPHEERGGEMSP